MRSFLIVYLYKGYRSRIHGRDRLFYVYRRAAARLRRITHLHQ
jgi:hypothetical protein